MAIAHGNKTSNGRSVAVKEIVPIAGIWKTPQDGTLTEFAPIPNEPFPIGVGLSSVRAAAGEIMTTAQLADTKRGCAGIVFGFNAAEGSGYFASVGGWNAAYALGKFYLSYQAVALLAVGSRENLAAEQDYRIRATISGVGVSLSVDGVEVFSHTLQSPPSGNQVGLYAFGDGPVRFKSLEVAPAPPRAFVVMQFGEPYDSLWKEVIKKVSEKAGYTAIRGDDVYRPGIVLQDIVKAIRTSDVVIAEVTPANPNVYYEVGYAQAIGIPTILLAEEDKLAALPFDISGYRCIFYKDAIRGKRKVEQDLRRFLENIKGGSTGAADSIDTAS